MKTLASLLGILAMAAFLSACGPDMNQINQASEKAEADVTRSEAAAKSAEDSVRKANDAVARLEAAFSTSVTK